MYPFNYHAPGDLDAALRLHREAREASYLAGGMTLIPALKQRLARPSDLIDLGRIAALRSMERTGGSITLGAMCTHAAVAAAPLVRRCVPALATLAAGIGDPQVRNRGTLGGAVANNDPAADYPAALLALDAVVITDHREIDAQRFLTGMFETALQDGELITACRFTVPESAGYVKFCSPASRYAIVGVMVARFPDRVRVAVTGAAACAFRLGEMEQLLATCFTARSIADVKIDPQPLNADLHATPEYRAHLVNVLARRAVDAALAT